jgi:lysozyme
MFEKLITQLKRHEGFRAKPYRDTVGKLTIGYGRNVDDVPLSAQELNLLAAQSQAQVLQNGISEAQATCLLILEVQRLHQELGRRLPWFALLDEVRQAVLINMAFNLGVPGLLKFKNTLALIQQGLSTGDFRPGARAMMTGNAWHLQVGDGIGGRFDRAEELAQQMETGQWAQP